MVTSEPTTADSTPREVHEWLSFDLDDETWLVDATFLTSNWQCIWGQGCPGIYDVPALDENEGCCSYGAHFSDRADRNRVKKAAKRLTAKQWQFRPDPDDDEAEPFIFKDDDGDWVSARVDGACIFLNRPGFSGGAGCALHGAAVAAGERPLDWKPDVCWQLPIRMIEETDENDHITNVVREWKRHDWGVGGDEFHWWCTEEPEPFTAADPVYVHQSEELAEMMGDDAYAAMAELLRARGTTERPGTPGTGVLLPHPARRPANEARAKASKADKGKNKKKNKDNNKN